MLKLENRSVPLCQLDTNALSEIVKDESGGMFRALMRLRSADQVFVPLRR